jgi:GT2 family glycosyltransferase
MQLSVIIVNYNVRDFLEQCLVSVQRAIIYLNNDAEIIVIDNNSGDGSIEYLQPKFPGVKFIPNKENLGFAKACNQGIQNSLGTYLLFLNPDTIVPGDCFQKCISFFTSHIDAGALGIKMVNDKGKYLKESKRGFPSPAASFFKLFGLAAIFPKSKLFAKYYLGHLDENKNQEVDTIAGAFMMIPRQVLEKVGGFDESFFMYGEDIDISYRIKKAGYKNYYLAETFITHFKGKSTQQKNADYTKVFYNAMDIFVKKHYMKEKNFLFLIFIRSGIGLRRMMALAGNRLTKIFSGKQ